MRNAALLRGVNVGGITIRSVELAEVFRGLGFTEVATVLASGNVRFEADAPVAELKPTIEAALRRRFGYQAWVHVLRAGGLAEIVGAYPFPRGRDGWHDYAVIEANGGTREELLAAAAGLDPALESAAGGDGVIYWTVRKGDTLDSVMGKALAASRHKPWVTTRTLGTLERLLG
jgi:uncharacterized protein (DUF1697 family)